MNRSSLVMGVIMLAIFAVLVAVASGYPADARFMPFVVGVPAIGLCLLQIVLDARRRPRPAEAAPARGSFAVAEETVSRMAGHKVEFDVAREQLPGAQAVPDLLPREMVRRELAMWAWFLGFVAGVLLFGFWISIPVFLVAFLRVQAKAKWRLALVLGVAATVILFLAFEKAFRIEVHPGFLTEYVSDRFRN
jgi:Tripartite tricarboxylate transporter TctB family